MILLIAQTCHRALIPAFTSCRAYVIMYAGSETPCARLGEVPEIVYYRD